MKCRIYNIDASEIKTWGRQVYYYIVLIINYVYFIIWISTTDDVKTKKN